MNFQNKKILHAILLTESSPGIEHQLLDECNEAKKANLNWDVKIFESFKKESNNPIYVKYYKNSKLFNIELPRFIKIRLLLFSFYKWLYEQTKVYDVIILRYLPSSIFQFLFLLISPKIIYLIHHANEPFQLKVANKRFINLSGFLELTFGFLSIRTAKGTIAVTHEIGLFQLRRAFLTGKRKYHVYPNAISIDRNKDFFSLKDKRNPFPTFLFVASVFYPWQGLDILLKVLSDCKESYLLYVVGEVNQDIKNCYFDEKRVKFMGNLDKKKIAELSQESWVGISSLALEREGLTEACALKVRDYLLMGLPVFGTYKETFSDSFLFYRKIDLEVHQIFEFTKYARKFSKEEIRTNSIPEISKEESLKKLIISLEEEFYFQDHTKK